MSKAPTRKQRLLSEVIFTPAKAWCLFWYMLACASVGFAAYFVLSERNFLESRAQLEERLSHSLSQAAQIYACERDESPDVFPLPLNLETETLPGSEDSAPVALLSCKGQKRAAGRHYYELRFVDLSAADSPAGQP
ncbi:MAG: hypothetical protein IJ228_07070 [Succinivibrio sp.]|nr:hypothetical protein [Succinivibrio sp.]